MHKKILGLAFASPSVFMLVLFFPMEDGTVAAGGVGTCEVHGIGTAGSGALAEIAVVVHREEHEIVVEVILPEECFGFGEVVGEAHITGESVAIDFHIAAIGTLQRDKTATSV